MTSRGGNNNPSGQNQHGATVKASDPQLQDALQGYQRNQIYNNKRISELLEKDYGIIMSERTVKRCREELGIHASGPTTRDTPDHVKVQLVLDAMADDPAGHRGPRTIQQEIAYHKGKNLTRDFVSDTMHLYAPEGFFKRVPNAKKEIPRSVLTSMGPNDEWSGDGHDKLNKIGFGVYGIRDKASGKWLGLWVVPNNRLAEVVAYLYLTVIEEVGGIPVQSTTDCGSETTLQFGIANALRNLYGPDFDSAESPAHLFLASIQDIVIERGWCRLRLRWGDNMVIFYNRGIESGIYNIHNPAHQELCQWLWSMFLRDEVFHLKNKFNSARVRKDRGKALPSGTTPDHIYSFPEKYGMKDCLIRVDVRIIKEIKESLGGDALLDFVSPEFAMRASAAFETLGAPKVTGNNIWQVFLQLLPLVFPQN